MKSKKDSKSKKPEIREQFETQMKEVRTELLTWPEWVLADAGFDASLDGLDGKNGSEKRR
jgi:hypothetical protein